MPTPLNPVLLTWAALVALCALPYLKLRAFIGLETTEAMQWSLVAIGLFGTAGILFTAWQTSRDRALRTARRRIASPKN
jgi:hypothetical protein